MLCQNCKEREANVRYTQIINGEKKEFKLCEKCAHKLGIGIESFKMPSHFSSFLGNVFDDFESNVFTDIERQFNRLNPFSNDIEQINSIEIPMDSYLLELGEQEEKDGVNDVLKDLKENAKINKKNNNCEEVIKNKKVDNNQSNKEELQKKLDLAIKEERFEDAAKIRDEIKKIK